MRVHGPADPPSVTDRADGIFQRQHLQICQDTDHMFAVLMVVQWLAGVVVALVVSPRTWIGATSDTHLHVWAAVLLGGAISSLPLFLAIKYPGHPSTRRVIATGQIVWSALLIHLTGGRIETHFHVFGSLAFLSFYRDWRLLITPAVIVAVDHFIRGIWWPQSVYGVFVESPYRWMEHVAWVAFELLFLVKQCRRSIAEMHSIAWRQARLEAANEIIEQKVIERTSELAASEKKLRAGEARLTAMLASTLDPMITVNIRGTIQAASDSIETVFGWNPNELVGQNVNVLMPEPYRSEHDGYLARYRQTGVTAILGSSRELPAMRRNGSVFPCLVTIWQVDLPDDPAPLFMGILRDMTQYKDREAKLESLHRQFVDAARQAGKAEIATNVLHNVGNVLNSVNVSCGMIRDRVSKSPVSDLTKAIDVMKQYLDDLASYITQDKRGKHLPRFLIDLSQQIAADQQSLCQETQSLADNIEHVKYIIALQQSLAGVSALVERVRLADVVEEAIRIGMTPAASYPIEIVREFEEVPPMTVDRQKLLQILVNLMSNAKQALVDSGRGDKQVVVRILRTDDDRIRIDIQDNGVGILPENKARIFSHGFTTRKNGHGFGLHSAAIAVMEMGGELSVQSDGPGKGATFSLEIPIPYVDVAPSLVETLQPR